MKIGVITTQYSPNYGALLQTYSLQRFLSKEYGEGSTEVINYFPPHSKGFWKIFPTIHGAKDLALCFYLLVHPKFVKTKKERFSGFKDFINNNILCSKPYYLEEELEELEECYDVVICGSDQIWNIVRHDDPNWFLYFARKWKQILKIAYAPSVADKIPEGHEKNLENYLANLDYISVREDVDVQQLQQYTNKDIYHACDPVFLLKKEEWDKVIPVVPIDEPYILCYFISTGDFAIKVVEELRKLTGLKVVHINVNIRDKFNADYDLRDVAPFEFVSYIKNAKFVCTNSFHCTAFSVLYKKDFYVVAKNTANSRMQSLMKKTGMQNRFITKDKLGNLTKDDLSINYADNDIREKWFQESRDYLTGAIEDYAKNRKDSNR